MIYNLSLYILLCLFIITVLNFLGAWLNLLFQSFFHGVSYSMIFKNFNDFLILWLLFSHDILFSLSGCKIISRLAEDIN